MIIRHMTLGNLSGFVSGMSSSLNEALLSGFQAMFNNDKIISFQYSITPNLLLALCDPRLPLLMCLPLNHPLLHPLLHPVFASLALAHP